MPFPPPRMTTKTPIERHFAMFWGRYRIMRPLRQRGRATRSRPSSPFGLRRTRRRSEAAPREAPGEARWTGQASLTINRRSQAASRGGSAQVAQLVEHATENRSVGCSIPALGSQGLSVVVRPNGTKLWLYRYRFGGKRKNMSLGTFPGVGLKAARSKRYDAEKLLDQGQDPVAVREAKRKEDEKLKHTFRAVGEEWATTKLENENKAKSTIKQERWDLAQLNLEIGDRPLCEIAPPEFL